MTCIKSINHKWLKAKIWTQQQIKLNTGANVIQQVMPDGPDKSQSIRPFFGLNVAMAGPAVPPPTALIGESVLFLNHCRCPGWSAPLFFANPRRRLFFSRRGPYYVLWTLRNSELKCSCAVLRFNSEHTNSGQTCITFGDEKPFFLISISWACILQLEPHIKRTMKNLIQQLW